MKPYFYLIPLFGLVLLLVVLAVDDEKALAIDENNCLSCHGNKALTMKTASGDVISLFVSESNVNTSAHRFIDCTTCHTTDPHNTATPLNKLSLADKCGTCHRYEHKLHLQSIHGQQLRQGNRDVATCVDCHSADNNPHSVIRVLEYGAPAYKKNIADTCAKCHGNEQLMSSYGIVEKVYESYMRSFHGKAIKLGTYEITQLDKATCTNCHGFHDVKSTDDPSSPVAGLENLASTCEQCHRGAGVEFAAGFLGHREASSDNVPQVHFVEVLFKVILITVISFGVLVMGAAMIRFSIGKWRK